MSWRLSADALEFSPYEGRTLLVLIALASWADDDGSHIYPRIETLAKRARCSVRQAQRALRQMEGDGVLVVVRKGGGRSLTEYRIDVEKLRGNVRCQNGTSDIGDMKTAENVTSGVTKPAAHIDTRSSTRSSTRSLSAPADAGESEKIASLGKGAPERFPEFRSVVANSWPGGFPADNQVAASKAWADVTRMHSADLVIACAGLHGRAKTEKQNQRGKTGGREIMRLPSNWLKEGDWQGYIPQAEEAARRDAATVTALGNVRRALGDGLVEVLKRAGMDDATMARLDGLTLAGDASFTVTSMFQRTLLEKHQGALERHFRTRPSFHLVQAKRAL